MLVYVQNESINSLVSPAILIPDGEYGLFVISAAGCAAVKGREQRQKSPKYGRAVMQTRIRL
jgi:hypothetical protein